MIARLVAWMVNKMFNRFVGGHLAGYTWPVSSINDMEFLVFGYLAEIESDICSRIISLILKILVDLLDYSIKIIVYYVIPS